MELGCSAQDVERALAECEREAALRRNAYPRWVAAGKLSAEAAERQRHRMELAAFILRQLARELRLEERETTGLLRERK